MPPLKCFFRYDAKANSKRLPVFGKVWEHFATSTLTQEALMSPDQ